MKKRFVIGMDFGTLSARAALIDASCGDVIAEDDFRYPHGIMDDTLKGGKKLPPFFALQDPHDYLAALGAIRTLLEKTGTHPEEVAGAGIDFTSCTMLPMSEDGVPLCFLPEFEDEPHAYVKAWKHHAAYSEADEINALAKERNEPWLAGYGGKISPEWMFPKILETLRNAPEVYEKADRFTEAADWISYLLTGIETLSPAFAGYKALWDPETGYPDDAFFEALDPKLRGIVGTKIPRRVAEPEGIAGTVNERGAELTGLPAGTPVALPMIDAHAVLPAVDAIGEGDLALILGTSACQIVNAQEKRNVEGICGAVRDAVVPGLFTYEAGQPAVGDLLDWFVRNHVPEEYRKEARSRGIGIHELLCEKAERTGPGESGLIGLDWLNGNRSVLVNSKLSGVLVGMTLSTKPEEEYRAWMEAAAFGTRRILEQFERSGIAVRRILATGGIAQKNPLMMRIFADVSGKEIRIASPDQASAFGSGVRAAVAAGLYPSLKEAVAAMTKPAEVVYRPVPHRYAVYDRLYAEYRYLYDLFGKEGDSVLERLNAIREDQSSA